MEPATMKNIQYILKAVINKLKCFLLIFCPLFACCGVFVTGSNNLINTHTAKQRDRFAVCHIDWTEEKDWWQICLDNRWTVFIFHMVALRHG